MDLCDALTVSMADPMLDAPRTLLTPHMAWQTKETFRRARYNISREHIKLFSRRTQPCRAP
jgi:phosphoglycerate dehydrogenase-like enzyme